MAGASRAIALGAVVTLLGSCTLTQTKFDHCSANVDCRQAFGIGSVCGGDGICEKAAPFPRCTQTFPEDLLVRPQSYPNILVYGSLIQLTNNGQPVGSQVARANAVRLAVRQVNEQNGLDGRLFGVVFCDISEDPQYDSLKRTDAAVASANYLADVIGAPAFVGPSSSPDVLAVFGAVKNKDVVVMSPSATSPELTTSDIVQVASDERPGLLWRTAFPDTVQGAAVSSYLRGLSPPAGNVTVIYESGAYGEGLERVFHAMFTNAGGTTHSLEFTAGNSGQRDQQITVAGQGPPQYVLFLSSQSADETAFVTEAQSYDSSVQLFLTDTAANTDVFKNAAGASTVFPRITGSRPASPDPAKNLAYKLFVNSYKAAFQQDPTTFTFVAQAYDGAWLVFYGTAYALRQERRVTGTGIARGLRKIASTGPEVQVTPENWKQISDALGAGQAVNLLGASGKLDYDPQTEETTGDIEIWNLEGNPPAIHGESIISPQ